MVILILLLGDAYPVLPADDHLVLLSMRFCPYAHRVMLVLNAKRIPHHVVNINLKRKPDWLTQHSPLAKVPALGLRNELGEPFIHESLIIADYLDDKYNAERPLYPSDPLSKAIDRLWIERFASVVTQFYRFVAITAGSSEPAPAGSLDCLYTGLDAYEVELKRRGTRFFCGDQRPGMLDYLIWPWFERLSALSLLDECQQFEQLVGRFPALVQYQLWMQKDETVMQTWLPADIYARYIRSHWAGEPNYDLLASL